MLRAAVILSLAVAALAVAVPENVHEQVIRFGSIGNTFADLTGVMTPVSPVLYKGIPAYDFVRIVDGVPLVETDKHFFRCSIMRDFYVPYADNPKPVMLCRNDAFEKSITADSAADKIAFLFSAENLVVPAGVSDIELQFGKNLWKSFIDAHATAFAAPVTVDSGAVRMGIMRDGIDKPFDSMLMHDIPVVRTKRQFGGGFSGSGAQAGASSFGGGGGFGGFPGGGFGGGFSGSQAAAQSSSFGGGGGGFFG